MGYMLKMTGVMLEKISDPDKYIFFEEGVSDINRRYIRASKNVNILYLDIHNLYGSTMTQYLPINNFKCLKNIEKIEQKLVKTKNNTSNGCTVKVYLEKPQEWHDIHNEYSLALEKINIPKEWLSNYCLKIASVHNFTAELLRN